MMEELTGGPPPMIRQVEVPPLPAGLERVPGEPVTPIDPQHVQAVDAVFTSHDENRMVSGFLGLWLGGPAVIDNLIEQFSEPEDEEPRKQGKDESSR
jgi:hypothetical protein